MLEKKIKSVYILGFVVLTGSGGQVVASSKGTESTAEEGQGHC